MESFLWLVLLLAPNNGVLTSAVRHLWPINIFSRHKNKAEGGDVLARGMNWGSRV